MSDKTKCPTCGQDMPPKAMRVSISGMYDCHLFHSFTGKTVDDVIANWIAHNATPNPAIVSGRKVDDLGPAELCPAIVLSDTGKELRRVGPMVFYDLKIKLGEKPKQLKLYREALMADPDIPRLLMERSVGWHD